MKNLINFVGNDVELFRHFPEHRAIDSMVVQLYLDNDPYLIFSKPALDEEELDYFGNILALKDFFKERRVKYNTVLLPHLPTIEIPDYEGLRYQIVGAGHAYQSPNEISLIFRDPFLKLRPNTEHLRKMQELNEEIAMRELELVA